MNEELKKKLAVLQKLVNEGAYSDRLHIIADVESEILQIVTSYKETCPAGYVPSFLDIGGRRGEQSFYAEGFQYRIMDLIPRVADTIVGDICNCPEIADESYDVVLSSDVLEHVKEPWNAAAECVRIAKPGGLLIHISPFSWRYHPFPDDYYRFTHDGLAYLFERTGRVEQLLSGYDMSLRRWNARGGDPEALGLDIPPIDGLGGWLENWKAVYVCRKL